MKLFNNIQRATWLLFCLWSLVIGVLLLLTGNQIRQTTLEIALSQAKAYFNKDVAFRQWVSKHGGLYVPVSPETLPSPYLSHVAARDVTTSDGTALTLLNPAYATRQHSEMFAELYGVHGHITSQKLLRPENAPDEWEQMALEKFEQGIKEVYEVSDIHGEPYLRLIQPLLIQEDCLKCHAHQNYKIGDVRGGVGISLSMAPLYEREKHSLFIQRFIFSSLWLLGSLFIFFGGNALRRVNRERDEMSHRMETLYQKSSDGILLIQDGKFIDCNESAVAMLGGIAKTKIIDSHPADFSTEVQPDGRSSWEKADELLQVCLEQGSNRFQWVHLTAQGKESWVEVVLTRIQLQDQPVIHVSWRDINELKKSQLELANYQDQLENMLKKQTAELETSHKKIQRLVDDMGEKFVVFSHKGGESGEITYVSEGVVSVFGQNKEDVIGHSWATLVDWLPEDLEVAHRAVRDQLEGQSDFLQLELRFIHPDGGQRVLAVATHPVHDESGEFLSIDGIVEDITEKKKNEQQLKRAQEQAEEANKQKSQFLANMSHEIRTPMNAMIGLSELALETNLSDLQYDYLSKIHTSSHNLLRVLNDILDYSKIEAGKMELEERTFSLAELIEEVSGLFVDSVKQKELELRLTVSDDVSSYFYGDNSRLRQILVNLLGNALKFTRQGMVELIVTLVSKTDKMACLKFSVIDSGIGIPADKIAQLFKTFSQLDASHTRKYGGTGLGLAISRELVEMMGGQLEVKSVAGKGSEFFFSLECKRVEQGDILKHDLHKEQVVDKQLAMRKVAGTRILLVEDDAINSQIAAEILARANINVEIAANGKEAVEKYELSLTESTAFSAILMDIQMPLLDGYGATGQIRALEAQQSESNVHIPIIAMTAHTMAGDRKKCVAAGMNGFISKPVDSRKMFILLARLIGETMGNSNDENSPSTIRGGDATPGIDFQGGLARCEGNAALYLGLLKQFIVEHKGTMQELKKMVQTGDIESASHLLHRFKGVSANLSVVTFAEAAFALEEVFAQKKDAVRALRLCDETFEECVDSIEEILKQEDNLIEKASPPNPVSSEQVTLLCKELTEMLLTNHFNATRKWSELKAFFPEQESGRVKKIDGYMSRFEFEKAAKLLTEADL